MRKIKNISIVLIFEQDYANQLERLKVVMNKLTALFDKPEIILITGYNDKYLLSSKYAKKAVKIFNDRYQKTIGVRALKLGLYAITNESVLVIGQEAAPLVNKLHSSKFVQSAVFLDEKIESKVGANKTTEKFLQNLWFDLPLKFTNMFYLAEPELEIVQNLLTEEENDRRFIFEVINQSIENGGEYEISV